jgi:predicted phosphodiesterase
VSTFSFAVVPDVHFHGGTTGQTHDPAALSVCRQILETQRLDALVQLGDLVDHENIGRFVRELPAHQANGTLVEEWELAKNGMAALMRAARAKNGRARQYSLEGNHEGRSHKYEGMHPQLRGMLNMPEHLGITSDPKATWVPSDSLGHVLRFVWAKDRPGCVVPKIVSPDDFDPYPEPGVTLLHGWSHGMNADKQTADMSPYPGAIIAGHSHRLQQKQAKRFGVGLSPVAYILGTMSRLNPGYVQGKPTGWQQSFAIVHMALAAPLVYRVDIVQINNGVAIGPCGKVFRSKV